MRKDGGEATDVVARAKEEVAAKQRRALAAKRLAAATSVTMGEPRSVFDRTGLEFIRRTKLAKRPEEAASAKMIGLLEYRKIPVPPDCTLSMFRRLLSTDEKREAKGLVRLGGVEWLRRFNVDGWKMTREVA